MDPWKPVRATSWGIATAAFAGLAIVIWQSPTHYVRVLDDANLLFHEAGHPLVGAFSSRLMVYGGTLFQLVFPTAITISYWNRRDGLGFSFGLAWFFENLLNIGRYMGDARAQVLPLVGGGEHDWANIFGRWGVLRYDTWIAGAVCTLGWLGLFGTWGWITRQYFKKSTESPDIG